MPRKLSRGACAYLCGQAVPGDGFGWELISGVWVAVDMRVPYNESLNDMNVGNPQPTPDAGGLTSEAVIGISVGAGVAGLLAIGIAAYCWHTHKTGTPVAPKNTV